MWRAPIPTPCAGRLGLVLLPVLWAASLAPAADKPPLQNTETSEGQWTFSALPKSFQNNPMVDETVITEMTEEGKKLAPPTRAAPVYYLAQPAGYHVEGHGTAANQPPPQAELETSMKQALAINGYLPAAPGQPPALLIVFVWGVHNNLDAGSAEVEGSAFQDLKHKNLLSRAALVGGNKFAGELKAALEKHERLAEVHNIGMLDPLKLFIERDWKTRQLYEQARADCYYVVASAYDYPASTRGERKLLWRSKMTVDAQGISMTETLPTLILNAGKYLGRDMPEPATIARRVTREGQTKLGPLEVKEYLEKSPAPAAENKPAAPPKPESKP
jgi:hypothetical protein